MRCPLNFVGLNKGSAGGKAPAVRTTADRGKHPPVNARVCWFCTSTDDAHKGETPLGELK